jgi:hypothetical protein
VIKTIKTAYNHPIKGNKHINKLKPIMKNLIKILLTVTIIFLGCKEDRQIQNIPFNPFEKAVVSGENQLFDLDTISLKENTGEFGTKIYYNRILFNVNKTDKITLELREFYQFQDLINNNIRTITTVNELLESSGVIYLDFKKNGESISLKDSTSIRISFPKVLSNQDKLFGGEIDSIGQISWSKIDAKFSYMKYDKAYGIELLRETTLDSLPYYQKMWREQDSIYKEWEDNYREIEERVNTLLSVNRLGWINIDKFIEPSDKKNIDLEIITAIDGLIVYVIYEGLNSFTSYYPETIDNVTLKELPIIGATYIIPVGLKNNELYAEKSPISEHSKLKMELKKISLSELERLLSEK